jgi:hypothetical protein
VKPQMGAYRSKAKEYARLTILTNLPRESRRYRKLSEMYRALAFGEEPENVQPLKMTAKTSPHMTAYPLEFHRRSEQKWALRAQASSARERPPRATESVIAHPRIVVRTHRNILGKSPWLREIGQWLRAGYDGVDDPLPEHLAALLKKLKGRRR